MTRVRWSALPKQVQGRLKNALRGGSPAQVLLFVPYTVEPGKNLRWGLVLLGTFVAALSWMSDFGEPMQTGAVRSSFLCPIVGLALCAWALAAVLLESRSRTTFGVNPGSYLFATHCIQVAGDALTVWDLADLESAEALPVAGGTSLRLSFEMSTLHLPVRDAAHIRQLQQGLSVLRAASLARARGDWMWLAARDPLGSIDLSTSRPPSTPLPALRAASVALGAVLAVALTAARTAASDIQVVRELLVNPSSEGWRWYIREGGTRSADAESRWLPEAIRFEDEAAFLDALSARTSTALEYYLQNHSIHADEVRATHLPSARLREASGSVARLRAFIAAHTDHPRLLQVATDEVGALYSDALQKLLLQVPRDDQALHKYFQRLFARLATSPDGKVEVVFRPTPPADLAAIDRLYQRTYRKECQRIASLESNFGAVRLAGSEQRVLEGLSRAFRQVVSNEALTFERVSEPSGTRPVIEVAYRVASSGSVYFPDKETEDQLHSECFIGTRIKFDVRMWIPGEKTRYAFTVNVLPPDRFEYTTTTRAFLPSSSTSDYRVYDVMTGLAFEQLADNMRKRLFEAESPAYEEMFNVVDAAAAALSDSAPALPAASIRE